jgi:aconitate hydratase
MEVNAAQQQIKSHRARGARVPGEPIEPVIDQPLTQDATGTLMMLEFESAQPDQFRCYPVALRR